MKKITIFFNLLFISLNSIAQVGIGKSRPIKSKALDTLPERAFYSEVVLRRCMYRLRP